MENNKNQNIRSIIDVTRENHFKSGKADIIINKSVFNMLIGYSFKDENEVSTKALLKMKELFDLMNEKIYEGDDELHTRFKFIHYILKARLELDLKNENDILSFCRFKLLNTEIEQIIDSLEEYKQMEYIEIRQLYRLISDRLNYIKGNM